MFWVGRREGRKQSLSDSIVRGPEGNSGHEGVITIQTRMRAPAEARKEMLFIRSTIYVPQSRSRDSVTIVRTSLV